MYINLILLVFTCCEITVKYSSIQVQPFKGYKWKILPLAVLYFYLKLFGEPSFRTPVIDTSQGSLVGKLSPKNDFNMYLGIRYASFDGRFKPPKPPNTWDHVYDASSEGDSCAQVAANIFLGTEDCLFLNVFTPKHSTKTSKLPVMVFIHGGSFRYGNGGRLMYSPDYLIKHNVVIVTMNYRLGALGFLCLGIEGAPGNAGLKDQLAALRWVKQNIVAFGGDVDNVTLFGESAGATSVTFHMLSPKSAGLFHKAIIQSGSALAPWSFLFDPIHGAGELVKDAEVNRSNPQEILKYYKKASVFELAKVSGDHHIAKLHFKACKEPNVDRFEPFLTESPMSILRSGNFTKIPVIAGINDAEGLTFYKSAPIESLITPSFSNIKLNTDDSAELFEKVKRFYLDTRSEEGIVDLYSDVLISVPLLNIVREFLSHSVEPIYTYYFKYDGGRNFIKMFIDSKFKGAAHGDDLFYLFQSKFIFLKPNEEDQLVIDRMTQMWTNFAKYGNPTPVSSDHTQWIPSTRTELRFLEIDRNLSMVDLPIKERLSFWDNISDEYGFKH